MQPSKTVGVIGLGYVGIPLAIRLSEVGMQVVGFDVDIERINTLNAGKSPIEHIGSETISQMRSTGFEATADFARSVDCDYLVICVPTPLNDYREPDLSFVESTMESLAPHLRKGQMLSLESTTWPGTSREVLLPYIQRAGLSVGEDFYLVYSPEREDPGNSKYNTRNIPKVVGGMTPSCRKVGVKFYEKIIDQVVPVSSTAAAEMVKLLENIHRSVNIGLMNELKVLTERMDLDIFEIVDAAATKPFGFTPYYPGPGIGGHCIPIDPFYLTWKAREYGLHTRFIELAGEINAGMPEYVIGKTVRALSEQGKVIKGAKILALGIAYKRDVGDMRESPSILVMELLQNWGADVAYSDKHVPTFPRMREHEFDLSSVELSPSAIAGFDAVILLTDHTDVDYESVLENAQLIIDTRGKYREYNEKVVRA